jgi:tetratricopeptide (TPR) repeat protein
MRIFTVAIVAVVLGQVACARHDPLKEALSSGQWGGVLSKAGAEQSGAVAGILRGHTLLLGNLNGEAVCEFVKEDSVAIEKYRTTTQKLLKRYPNSAVAEYLVGDSLARSARWPEAIASFDRALAVDKRFALALVARGVALVAAGKLQDGKRDLYSALMMDPKLAEAQAAMGWTLLKEGQPAATARNYFAAAVQLSPGYSLAAAGKAFAQIAAGDAEKGANGVVGQLRPGSCEVALLVSNSLLAASWVRTGGAVRPEDAPGTQIDAFTFAAIKVMVPMAVKNTFTQAGNGDPNALALTAKILAANSKSPIVTDAYKALTSPQQHVVQQYLSWTYSTTEKQGPAYQIYGGLRRLDDLSFGHVTPVLRAVAAAMPGSGADAIRGNSLKDLQDSLPAIHDRAGFALKALTDLKRSLPNDNFKVGTPPKPPAGATTSLDGAQVDQGKWPFKPVFGLLYPMS